AEVPKPSEGLEYTYARKPSNFDHERKDLAHIWEVGGSQEFAEEIALNDQLFLTAKQVTTAVVVIVVDLSDPGSVLPTLLWWLEAVKRKLGATYEKFEKKGLQLPEQLRQRAKSKLYSQNEDKDAVWHSGISLVIAATKYDSFKNADPEVKKVMARTLRWLAHAHGAFLMYLGGLHVLSGASDTSKDAVAERNQLDSFTRLTNHLIFTGLEKKPVLKQQPQVDHSEPLMVPAGTDRFKDIGRPRGAVDGNVAAGSQVRGKEVPIVSVTVATQEWCELCDKFFPRKEKARAAKFEIDARYREEEVDLVKARKLQELEAYRREQELAKEASKKAKAAMPKAAAAAASPARGDKAGAAPAAKKKPAVVAGQAVAAAAGSPGVPAKPKAKAKPAA
ncbi:hypothetical protein QJQ45_018044, partial [Haematococcus lacustris]